jgi:hypothetical protein
LKSSSIFLSSLELDAEAINVKYLFSFLLSDFIRSYRFRDFILGTVRV